MNKPSDSKQKNKSGDVVLSSCHVSPELFDYVHIEASARNVNLNVIVSEAIMLHKTHRSGK